jgi:phage-related holin
MKSYLDQALEFCLKFFSMLFVILLPIRSVMIAVSLLVIADMITGIWASLKEGKKISSNGLRRTVAKTLAYQLTIVVSFIIETYLIDGIPVVKVVSGLIAITEGKSFFENMERITGVNYWTELLSKIQGLNSKQTPDNPDAK